MWDISEHVLISSDASSLFYTLFFVHKHFSQWFKSAYCDVIFPRMHPKYLHKMRSAQWTDAWIFLDCCDKFAFYKNI